jgi:hypothetical protein
MLPSDARQYRNDLRDRCDRMGEPAVREALATGTFGNVRKRHVAEEWLRERSTAAAKIDADGERATDREIAREANDIARAANGVARDAIRQARKANRIAFIAFVAAVGSAVAAIIPLFQ